MRNVKSKHFVKSKLIEDFSINSIAGDFDRDDEDPLSLKRLPTKLLGIFIAFLTILLPSLSVYYARPSSQENEITINHLIKKDGS